MKNTVEYKLIARHYGVRIAQRSQIPLINHIDEGLIVLDCINATNASKRAFCLHPLFQADEELKVNWHMASFIEPHVLLLTMEYRNIANAFLSDKMRCNTIVDDINLSPLFEVNHMLIADKVQNRKDYITYHQGTHPHTMQLDLYFDIWLRALDISEEKYENMCKAIERNKK